MRQPRTLLILAVAALAACRGDEGSGKPAIGERRFLDPAKTFEIGTLDDPSVGPDDAPIVIVEFTDYSCEFCERHHREVYPELRARYGDRLRYVIKNFPVVSEHPNALAAAQAAECAHEQGDFWAFHDTMFAGARDATSEQIRAAAAAASLDLTEFDDCVGSGRPAAAVQSDIGAARLLGVQGSPTFLVMGEGLIQGAKPLEAFVELIAEA